MALIKQPLDISFAQGMDQKTDPFRVQPGKFLSLQNSVFDKAGRLTKRNGYGSLPTLPDETSKFLTTFNGNLTALGTEIEALGIGSDQWFNKGYLQPISLITLPLIRSNTNQSQADTSISPNKYVCTVFTDNVPVSGVLVAEYKYGVADSVTGQNIVEPTLLVTGGSTFGTPRVFLLNNYFVIIYTNLIGGASHLQYIAISIYNPNFVTAPVDISTSYNPSTTVAWDGLVVNSKLYVAYNTTSGGQSVKVTYIAPTLGAPVASHTYSGQIATMFSLAADLTTPSLPIIYISYYNLSTTDGFVLAVDQNVNPILAPTAIIAGPTILNLASTAKNGSVTIFQEVKNAYGYDPTIPTNYIQEVNVTQSGTVSATTVVVRSVGLASKAFLFKGISYFLGVYFSVYQPSYFLINQNGLVISKLAYSNGGPYDTTGLPNVSLTNDVAQLSYLYKDLIQAVNKTQNPTTSEGVYTQTGINLASFDMDIGQITDAEIGNNLNISGGIIAAYDGYEAVEQGFFLWPDNIEVTTSTSGGSISAQEYFYQVTYEWSDNQGNNFRSAPSVPVSITTTGSTSSNTIFIPTLRLTYKIVNPVKIVIYRWSTGQQTYYQVTSVEVPLLNDPTVDYITYVDTLADSSIVGDNIIYTTGGVLEDVSPPSSSLLSIFNNRLWLVDAEDQNLLWYSKQVIEATPVEMSDLLTLYVPPTTSTTGSTGPITALSPMDDKLIIFKQNALGYINGIGPDNTGANSSYSDFVLINSVVGCTNQQSIVFMPQGLMFQSNKGIWLLGRDLSTQYIGAPVEDLTTGALVQSAVNVPFTNQVRFTLDTGITLMYDYYFGQWGTFVNVPAISSTIYQNLHTYVNDLGQVFQETIGMYLDNTSPVLMAFTTGWISLAGVQGYERFYQMYLLGQYITPFKLNVQLAYDYNPSFQQATILTPSSPSPAWGGDALWGSNQLWGGPSQIFEERLFPDKQKCESFQVSMNEIYDPSFGIAAGAGLTLTGLNLIVGMKRAFRTQSAAKSFG
jgi:hypothetical protein